MATMKDIAKHAGVSRTTVSFILNDAPQAKLISQETKEKVLKSADELGYIRNEIARSVKTGKTRVIGLITRLPEYEFIARMCAGILSASETKGYFVKFFQLTEKTEQDDLIRKLREQRVDGVITFGYPSSQLLDFHKKLKEYKIPMGVVGNSPDTEYGIRVISDDIQGAFDATTHLIEMGHTKIAFAGSTEPTAIPTTRYRYMGYKKAIEKAALKEYNIQAISGAFPVTDFMKSNPDITAFVCVNHTLAASIMTRLKKIGYKIPEDVSVIGYSKSELCNFYDPPITTMDQPHYQMGYEVTTRLIDSIEKSPEELFKNSMTISLPVSLFKGGSTAQAKS